MLHGSDIFSVGSVVEEYGEKNKNECCLLGSYFRASDYEGILSLDLRHMTMVRIDGVPFEIIAAKIAAECPFELKKKYPERMLRLAYEMYAGGMAREYEKLMSEISEIIPCLPLSAEEKAHLTGEWIIVSIMPRMRDIRYAAEKYREAAGMMRGKSRVIDCADSFTMGQNGLVGVYLMEPGTADELLPLIREAAELYSYLVGEAIPGIDILYEASLFYHRGNLNDAKQLAYKAAYLLETTKQDALQISAGELLALISIVEGDVRGFGEAIDYMELAAERSLNRPVCKGIVGLIKCSLLSSIGAYRETPGWLRNFSFATGSYGCGPFLDKPIAGNIHFAPVSYGVASWCHTQYLLMSGQYERALAMSDIMLELMTGDNRCLILSLVFTIISACCFKALGNLKKARSLTERAVELAVPDGIYIMLSYFDSLLGGMVEDCFKKYNKNFQKPVSLIKKTYINGVGLLSREYADAGFPDSLTKREKDVARLAAQGMRNVDISESLCISENTVKAHLKSIFEKLDVDKRSKLREKLK